MGIKFFFLSFFLSFSWALKAQEVLLSDVLVLRLQSKSILLKDLNAYGKSLEQFHCLMGDQQHFLKLIGLETPEIKKLQTLGESDLQKERPLLEKARRALVLQLLSGAREVPWKRERAPSVQKREACGLGTQQGPFHSEIRSLLHAQWLLMELEAQQKRGEIKALHDSLDTAVDFEYFL